jgi:hypothetical protein
MMGAETRGKGQRVAMESVEWNRRSFFFCWRPSPPGQTVASLKRCGARRGGAQPREPRAHPGGSEPDRAAALARDRLLPRGDVVFVLPLATSSGHVVFVAPNSIVQVALPHRQHEQAERAKRRQAAGNCVRIAEAVDAEANTGAIAGGARLPVARQRRGSVVYRARAVNVLGVVRLRHPLCEKRRRDCG